MKKLYTFLAMSFLCLFFVACAGARGRLFPRPEAVERDGAVEEIVSTKRSKIEMPAVTMASTAPQYFEVVAVGTTAATTTAKKEPEVTTKPKEYCIVKFVDTDGYTAVSVQTVEKGKDAVPPVMPQTRGNLVFRGWNRDYTNIQSGRVIGAIYQKEWLNVRFFDADGTLLTSETVRYGESATAPEVEDRGDFLFDGWSVLFGNVTEDLDVYATYYETPKRSFTHLDSLYSMLDVTENSLGIPAAAYYRKEHTGVLRVGKHEYAGNILYGNFCDTLPIGGYGFTEFAGMLAIRSDLPENHTYALRLTLLADGKEVYNSTLSGAGTRSFSISLAGVETLTVYLEPTVDGALYYGDVSFFGGITDAVLYEN